MDSVIILFNKLLQLKSVKETIHYCSKILTRNVKVDLTAENAALYKGSILQLQVCTSINQNSTKKKGLN